MYVLGFSRCINLADVAFLVDSSGSLHEEGFLEQKDFIKTIVETLDVSPSDSQIGVITYSDKATVAIKFSDYEYQEDLIKGIEALQYNGKTTRIDKAIAMATKELIIPGAGRREDTPGIMVILTDGRQTPESDTTPLEEAAANLEQLGIRTLVVGIGELANEKELRKMTVRDEDVFLAPSLKLLPNFAQPVAASICEAAGINYKSLFRLFWEQSQRIGPQTFDRPRRPRGSQSVRRSPAPSPVLENFRRATSPAPD